MRGKPVLLRNCEEHIDNIITPLMHHRNTANEDDRNEGMCDWVKVVVGRGGVGRGLLRNCEEHIDNIITPLMHQRNTANEDDRNEGMCDRGGGCCGEGRGGEGQGY